MGEADFIYVLTEKTYILHLLGERKQSYSHAPLCALAEGVFLKRETATRYAAMYAGPNDSPLLDKATRLQAYAVDKS